MYFRGSFFLSIVKFEKYEKKTRISRNLKFIYLGVFLSLKFRNLLGKILRISLKLNFTQNTLGCYGLTNMGEGLPYTDCGYCIGM